MRARGGVGALGRALLAGLTVGGCAEQGTAGRGSPGSEPASLSDPRVRADASALVSRYVVFEGPSALASVRGRVLEPGERAKRVQARAQALRALHGPVAARVTSLGGEVVADLTLVANALQVRVPAGELAALARLPGVARLEIPSRLRPTLGAATPLIGAPEAWESGAGLTGSGVRIGVIDTGIDYQHAALGGSGVAADFDANDPELVEPGSFPTAKVIGGKDLAGDAYDAAGLVGSKTPTPDDDPRDCQGHGTHVSAIAAGVGVLGDGSSYAGPYDLSLDPGAFSIFPGAAPGASVFAIKIGGCGDESFAGESELLLPAFELAADPDEDGDPSDRLDVVNLSFGSAYANPLNPLEQQAVIDLTDAGTLLVAAAGNDGGASFTTAFPASEPRALSVGASLKQLATITYQAVRVTAPVEVAALLPLGLPDAAPGLSALAPFSGAAVTAVPDVACEPLSNAAELDGKVALIRRGACTFDVKAQHAMDAGAVAVLIVDNAFTDEPTVIGGPHVLPTFRLRKSDGEALIAAAPVQLTFDEADTVAIDLGPDYVAIFSSRGPTADRALLKPDLVAPGVEILSAAVGTGSEGVAFSGTSMATPITAGAAALLRQSDPALGPDEVRALLVSTAQLASGPLERFPASAAGAGRVSIDAAIAAPIFAQGADASGGTGLGFGLVKASQPTSVTRALRVDNRSAAPVALEVGLEPALDWPGMTFTVSPSDVVVPASGSVEVELELQVDPALLPVAPAYSPYVEPTGGILLDGTQEFVPNHLLPEASGRVVLTPAGGGPPAAVVAYSGAGRASAERSVGELSGCAADADVTLSLAGTPAHHDNATSVLELGTTESSYSAAAGEPKELDIVATGALSSPDNERVYFGVVTAGDWVTPSRGYVSPIGVEVDTDDDEVADYLVVVESFSVTPGPVPFYTYPTTAFYARVVDLESGELSQTFEYVNGAYAAYPGGVFREEEAHESSALFNRVLVLPVELAALGLDPAGGPLSYRAVSGVSRLPPLVGEPLLEPTDASAWVQLDAAAPHLSLPGCFAGTPLCPEGTGEIALGLAAELEPPELLVLHHSNASGPGFETVSLSGIAAPLLSLAVAGGGSLPAGERGDVTFTVRNEGPAAASATLAVSVEGGALESLEADGIACAASACELGDLAAGAEVTVVARARAGEEGELQVAAELAGSGACAGEPALGEASFEIRDDGIDPVPDDGCGCEVPARSSGHRWPLGVALAALAAALLRRRVRARS